MKCPVIMSGWNAARGGVQVYKPDCLKEDCAWWYQDGARCCILDIDLTLNCSEIALSDIVKELPKLRPNYK